MAWIKVINESEAEGKLKETYERFTAPWGGVDNILKNSQSSTRNL